jgi:hypothetical protein
MIFGTSEGLEPIKDWPRINLPRNRCLIWHPAPPGYLNIVIMAADEFRQLTRAAIQETDSRNKAYYATIFNKLRDQCRDEAKKGHWFKEFDGPLDVELIVMFRSAGFDVNQYNPQALASHCKDCDTKKGTVFPVCELHVEGMKAQVSWDQKSY